MCHAAVKLRLCYLYLCRCTICMYRKLLANMSPFSLYVLLYIMVVRISVDFIRKKMFLTEAVFILICCCALLKFISNMQYIIIYFKMILPENEFSLLKGVNNQPYLDIWTSASHLTKRFLFSCISFFFLPSYVFYIHPIGHLWAFWLCVKTSLNAKPFIWFAPAYRFISW